MTLRVPAAPTASPGTSTTQVATTAFTTNGLALKANLASPAFSGVPTAPTATPGTATTQIATTAFVEPPVQDRMLVINGTGSGLVNNLCVPSEISSSCAPDGCSLVSATVLNAESNDNALHNAVAEELRRWFGQ